ncbi:MAG: ribonuclease H-like domain-containing protein [SAR324 cluster bacterium]|nr:ribonuclease H-like domain-containing protein [SAR324 cluster bacterium]
MSITEPILVFDLETQRDFQSVGGRAFIDELKMSVGVVWDSKADKFFTYRESAVEELITHLSSGSLVIGFNHLGFDFEVLSGYRKPAEREDFLLNLKRLKNLDLMLDIRRRIGYNVSLDSLVSPTLNAQKTADGLLALRWFREYQDTKDETLMEKIIHYCKQDVLLTRDLYLKGLKHQRVLHKSKTGELRAIEVDWKNYLRHEPTQEKAVESQKAQLNLF